jgi:preprotein translocase SecE subunit
MAKESDTKKKLKTSLAPEGEAKSIFNWYRSDAKRKLNVKLPRIPMPGFLKFKIPIPRPIRIAGAYIKNSFTELRSVTWPNRRLSFNYTISVILFSVVFSILLTGVDWVFTELVKKMLL